MLGSRSGTCSTAGSPRKRTEPPSSSKEYVDPELVAYVVDKGYAPDLNDQELEQIGRDPFLIAYALAAPVERCVVTTEVSAPKKQRQNRKIPDVCASLGVSCCDTFTMLRALGFTTGWGR